MEKEFFERYSFYERACNFSEKILPISPPQKLKKKLKETIDFSHLKITPRGAFSFLILFLLSFIIISLLLITLLGFLSLISIILILFFSFTIGYFIYNYPFHYFIVFRIKASSEMVLAIVYMSISMRISPNLEKAVEFAAKNLRGALAYDLKKLLWDIEARKFISIDEALDAFTTKWEKESEEFVDAIGLIKSSLVESQKKREEALDEAVGVVLDGTRERMKRYARELKTPVTVINGLGILLPIIGLIFFPMVGLLFPGFQSTFLFFGYDFLLPLFVYWIMKNYLDKRPYSFHQPEVYAHPEWRPEKVLASPLLISLLVSIPLIVVGAYYVGLSTEVYNLNLVVFSLLIVWGIGNGFILWCVFSAYPKLKLRQEVAQIENEFIEVSYSLGVQLSRGLPLEGALKKLIPKIKELRISGFFEKILYNIELFGMTLEQAIFDEHAGALKLYPSSLIRTTAKTLIETSKRGFGYAARTLMTVSSYLKDVHKVEEGLKDLFEEVTSTMRLQSLLLVPLTSGFVVTIVALMLQMMLFLKGAIEAMYEQLGGMGIIGQAGAGILTSIINVSKMTPIHGFQLVVGIYLMEIVALIAMFLSMIENGEENILKRINMGKMLFISMVIYTIILITSLLGLSMILPLVGVMT